MLPRKIGARKQSTRWTLAKLEEAIAAIRAGKRVKTSAGAFEYDNLVELAGDIADTGMLYDAADDVFEIVEPAPEPATDEEIVAWLESRQSFYHTGSVYGGWEVRGALKLIASIIRTRKLPTP